MKKVLIFLVIMFFLGLVGGFLNGAYKSYKKASQKNLIGTNSNGSNNVFTSIKDALSKSMSLKCVYKDEKGKETISYIKGGSVRVMVTETGDAEQYGNVLIKNNKMYMWNEVSKTGFMFNTPNLNKTTPLPTLKENNLIYSPEESSTQDQELVISQIEKYKDSCKTEVITDSFFTVPTDVKFQDMSNLFK